MKKLSTFPHICGLLTAFFKGAEETWKQFTSEFTPGGLIDQSTAEEKEPAWMPATNDINEGAQCFLHSNDKAPTYHDKL